MTPCYAAGFLSHQLYRHRRVLFKRPGKIFFPGENPRQGSLLEAGPRGEEETPAAAATTFSPGDDHNPALEPGERPGGEQAPPCPPAGLGEPAGEGEEDAAATREQAAPLEIRFFPGEDQALLEEAQKGTPSPGRSSPALSLPWIRPSGKTSARRCWPGNTTWSSWTKPIT